MNMSMTCPTCPSCSYYVILFKQIALLSANLFKLKCYTSTNLKSKTLRHLTVTTTPHGE